MRKTSAVLAIIAGLVTLLGGLIEFATTRPNDSLWIGAGISVAFMGSAIFALMGRAVWLLAIVWAAALVAYVVLIFRSNVEMGLMQGGLLVVGLFLYLLAGLILSLLGLGKHHGAP